MSIKVLYFASLKEKLGRSHDEIDAADITTAGGVWHRANPNRVLPEHTLIAVNMDYGTIQSQVKDGDEVAFFPPVTGG
jgi:sulfur-carrier protein